MTGVEDYEPAHQAPAHVDPAARYDALWRKQPAVPGFIHFCRAIPGYAAQFLARVPETHVAHVDADTAEVTCPCGETARCRWNGVTECACGRVFASLGGTVRVGYSRPVDGLVD